MLPVWDVCDAKNQYFPDDVIELSQQEVFVDCGAFTGDTLDVFCKKVGFFDKYYALEPDATRFSELNNVIERVRDKGNIVHCPVGVSDKSGGGYFLQSSVGCGQMVYGGTETDGQEYIKLDTIDNLLTDERATFIKMDIEGEEMHALKGAENTIQRDKPKLAICVYHKREDLITIPKYLKSLVPEYSFFLRAHWPGASEVVLYCVCGQGS